MDDEASSTVNSGAQGSREERGTVRLDALEEESFELERLPSRVKVLVCGDSLLELAKLVGAEKVLLIPHTAAVRAKHINTIR